MLDSLLSQTLLPYEVMVVNDNSTDNSPKIIREYTEKHAYINTVNTADKTESHLPGSKIINAFYTGLDQLQPDWDIIVKLDGDLVLPEIYFEKLIETFESDPQIGMAGGVILIFQDGEWVFEDIKKRDSIRGALKAYTRSCFEKIGGPRPTMGWDTLDELLARYYGFKIKVLPELEVRLQKPTGTDYKKIHGEKIGEGFYSLDYGLFISLIASAKAAWKRKRILLMGQIMLGYFKAALKSDEKQVTKEEGKFIRNYRRQGIFRKLGIGY